MYSGLQEKIG